MTMIQLLIFYFKGYFLCENFSCINRPRLEQSLRNYSFPNGFFYIICRVDLVHREKDLCHSNTKDSYFASIPE